MNTRFILTLGLLLARVAVNALDQPLTVEFAGEVTHRTPSLSVAPGTLLVGTFAYDPRQSDYQSSTQPFFSFDILGTYSFRLTGFIIGVRDNYSFNPGDRPIDDLTIQFSHSALDSGAGILELSSYNTVLFHGTALPATFPSLDQFDASSSLSFHRGFEDITEPGSYRAVGDRIDQLAVVPEPATGLLLGIACLLACLGHAQRKLRHAKVSTLAAGLARASRWRTCRQMSWRFHCCFIAMSLPCHCCVIAVAMAGRPC